MKAVWIAPCAGLCALMLAAGANAAAPPPPNDAQTAAIAIDATSSSTAGTTDGGTLEKTDPANVCGVTVTATVWYRLNDVPDRQVVLRLAGQDGLDAAVAVYRLSKGRLAEVDCAETEDDDVATFGFDAAVGDLVIVGQRPGSAVGGFTLQALVPQAPEAPPGKALKRVGDGTVEEFLDDSDLWHADLRAGTTYRISFIVPGGRCPSLRIHRAGAPKESFSIRCNGAGSFTPGPDGGGRYQFVVGIAYASGRVPYRINVVRAQADDTAPGVKLAVGVWRSGRLDPRRTDQLDMYRFTLADRSDITLQLAKPWSKTLSVQLIGDNGHSLAAGHAIRRPLAPGTYYAVVQAPAGTAPVTYRLLLRVRGVSHMQIPALENGAIALGTPLVLTATIGHPSGRAARLQVDRFDPVDGWLYLRTYTLPVAADALATFTWNAPSIGWYRFRIVAPSRSHYRVFQVTEPVATGG
jgi:hypothetical protein